MGITSCRFFIVKSGYLICYNRVESEKLAALSVKNVKEYVEVANRQEIKRVILLRDASIEKRVYTNQPYPCEIIISPTKGRSLHLIMKTMEEGDIWYSVLVGSRMTVHMTDFDVLSELGQGSFGIVKLVRYHQDNHLYALKTVQIKDDPYSLRRFVEERTIMQTLQDCPFIIQLRMAFQEDYNLHYVLEYCERGDLQVFFQ